MRLDSNSNERLIVGFAILVSELCVNLSGGHWFRTVGSCRLDNRELKVSSVMKDDVAVACSHKNGCSGEGDSSRGYGARPYL